MLRCRKADGSVQRPEHKGFGTRANEDMLARRFGGIVSLDHSSNGVTSAMELPSMDSSNPPERGRLRLLIVEDEALIAIDLKDMVEDLGHEVVGVARNVEEAFAQLEATRPTAAVVDANLGGESAEPVTRRLRQQRIPFLLSTGYDKGHLESAGLDGPTLTKPFSPEQLSKALTGLSTGG